MFGNCGNHLQDLLVSKHVVDSFGSIYTLGPLTDDIMKHAHLSCNVRYFLFQKLQPLFIITDLQYVVNSSAEDFFIGLHPCSHSGGTALSVDSYYAPRHDTFTGVSAAPNPKLYTQYLLN